ncbi:MAG TPA: hypothetical protein VHV82_06060 [Sporichthyaceae bacterium]|jgi:hypothetical protein|nr:hypothetical protein [Sporichthyaceae bacterium]
MLTLRSLAVVDQDHEDNAVIWWVGLAEVHQRQRLCGAWVLSPTRVSDITAVTTGRWLLPTPAGREVLAFLRIAVGNSVDPARLAGAVAAERTAIAESFERIRSQSRSRLAPLSLPPLPPAIDLETPPALLTLPEARRALLIARQVETWADTWNEIEERRLARPHLRDQFGNEVRLLPGLNWAEAKAA